jgi:ABC-type Fe3+/spermidine/putrescine transport system ATPase subunit
MNAGQIVQHCPPRELYDEPTSVFAATFIGEANVLACEVTGVEDGVATITCQGIAMEARASQGVSVPGTATLCVRPERLTLTSAEQGPGGFDVIVTSATFEGGLVRYGLTVHDTGAQLMAELPVRPGEPLHAPGTRLKAVCTEGDCHVLAE